MLMRMWERNCDSAPGNAASAPTDARPYFLALVANSLLNRNRAEAAVAILKRLAGDLKSEGYLDGATTSITGLPEQ